jgi:hypothetical protein
MHLQACGALDGDSSRSTLEVALKFALERVWFRSQPAPPGGLGHNHLHSSTEVSLVKDGCVTMVLVVVVVWPVSRPLSTTIAPVEFVTFISYQR